MKVLISTRRAQGNEPGDYNFTVDGELVTVPEGHCDSPSCGCDRGFGGLSSHKATTTAEVAELAVDLAGLRAALQDSLEDRGWLDVLDDDEIDELVDEELEPVLKICRHFPVGTVVRRKGDQVRPDWAAGVERRSGGST